MKFTNVKDGDQVVFLDSDQTRDEGIVGLTGRICYSDYVLGTLVSIDGQSFTNDRGTHQRYTYFMLGKPLPFTVIGSSQEG